MLTNFLSETYRLLMEKQKKCSTPKPENSAPEVAVFSSSSSPAASLAMNENVKYAELYQKETLESNFNVELKIAMSTFMNNKVDPNNKTLD